VIVPGGTAPVHRELVVVRRKETVMDKAIVLAVAASVCTAASSVCQRMAAKSTQARGFDVGLVVRLARRPVWLLGIASMIGGFVFQLTALRFGDLSLVQPILAAELVFVFGYLAIAGSGRVRCRDWLAAAAMSAGIGVFLRLASPSAGRLHAPGSSWLLCGLVTAALVAAALVVGLGRGRRPGAAGSRRAAVLGAVTGISWGFMAAVIKELSSHLGGGPAPSCPAGRGTCWSPPGRRRCCWPRTRWRPGRWPPLSPGSPSSIRCRPACSGCCCSASISGPEPLTWPARRSRWPWSSPARWS
jgi:hypothetical protein